MPLLYYIFPFQNYFGDVFFPLLQSSPIVFSIIYILIFSATKQVGALLFSLAFWTASKLRKEIHKSATSQLDLLKTIGLSQMEKEFEGKIKSLQKQYGLIDKNKNWYGLR